MVIGDTFTVFALATGSGAIGVDDVRLDFAPMDESAVPEPASVGLVGAGLLSLALRHRRFGARRESNGGSARRRVHGD